MNINDSKASDTSDNFSRKEVKELMSDAVASAFYPNAVVTINSFSGESECDVTEWIHRYEAVANAHRWDDDTKFNRLKLYLSGPAQIWYQLEIENDKNPTKQWDGSGN